MASASTRRQPVVALHGSGGGALSKGGSESLRACETLFESKSINDIREVEKRTRKDVDLKKQALRQLVGGSYRDLIETTDKIVSIAAVCDRLLSNVKGIQGGFSSLAHGFASSDNLLNEKRNSLSKHEVLHAIGARVKYIVDTPEVIWGCLDSAQYLEAARRLLRAHTVRTLLLSSFPKDQLARFPLLAHHWPLVEKFRKQISDAVAALLSSEAALATPAAADALAAAALLQGLGSAGALDALLRARTACLVDALGRGDGAAGGAPAAVARLSALVQAIQTTFCQVGELFLRAPGSPGQGAPPAAAPGGDAPPPASCLLQATVREGVADASELLFASVSASGASVAAGAPESRAWRAEARAAFDGLAALSSGQVEAAVTAWLRGVAAAAAAAARPLLASCTSAQELVEVEAGVRAASARWAPHGCAGKQQPQQQQQQQQRGAKVPPRAGGSPDTWEAVCEWVAGFQVSVWAEVLHAPFVAQCKALISSQLAGAGAALDAPLQECLDAAAAAAQEPPGRVASQRWPLLPMSDGNASGGTGGSAARGGIARTWSDAARKTKASAPGLLPTTTHDFYRQRVHTIRAHFDASLSTTLSSVLLLLSPATTRAHGELELRGSGGLHRTHSSTGGSASDVASRAAELEPYVQDACAEMAAGVASRLSAQLSALGTPRDGALGTHAAEAALLLGRLCSGLGTESRVLPVLLGPPEAWRAAAGGGAASAGSRARGGPARAAPPSARLSAVVAAMQSTAVAAYQAWAAWAASALASELHVSLASSDALRASATPRSWHEVVVPMGGAGGGAATDGAELLLLSGGGGAAFGDMRFWLPACPSPSAMAFLSRVCAEAVRAGDHTATPDALAVLAWEAGGAALSALSALLADTTEAGAATTATRPALSEKGVLQLLLDARVVRDVTAGGRPLSLRSGAAGAAAAAAAGGATAAAVAGDDPAVTAAVAARRRECARLEGELQDRLDPIDWATYEPYFWRNVARYTARTSVLFGTLLQLARGSSGTGSSDGGRAFTAASAAASTTVAAGDMNALSLLPVAPRFQYLPISAPATGAHHHYGGGRVAAALPGAPPPQLLRGALGSSSSGPPGALGLSPAGTTSACAGADLGGAHSFADLGTGRSSAAAAGGFDGSGGDDGADGANGAGLAGGLSALQARLHAGGIATGLGLGEMAALASQRFDGFADFGSGLFSSLAKASGAAPAKR
ncbi:hypothetical protein FOA52_004860 [Chlamydomonas sp. UWO 241]|nr:hypothetical protein FOA52_004860 [Chlamydomonas sp. UWO 241]